MMKNFTKVQNLATQLVNNYLSLPLLFLFIFLFSFSVRSYSQAPIKVIVPNITVSCNDTATLAVTIQDYDSILTSKFVLSWDSSELKFISISKLNTTLNLNVNANFGPGLNAWKNGKPLIFLYTEPTLNGINLPDNDTLFVLKFKVTDTIGQTTFLKIVPDGNDVIKLSGEANVIYSGGAVLLKDVVPPVVSCPKNLTLNTAPGNNTLVLSGSGNPVLTDNCDSQLDLSYFIKGASGGTGSGNANGTLLNVGISTVNYVAKDDDNNKDTCDFTVTVNFTPGNNSSTDTLIFKMPSLTNNCNTSVDIPVQVENFKGIASTKLTIFWNKSKLNYQSITYRNPKLGILNSDFTLNSDGDSLTLLWTQAGGLLDTLKNNDTLFVVRLNSLATDDVKFSSKFDVGGGVPLAQITKIKAINGKVTVVDNIAPTVVCPTNLTVNTTADSTVVTNVNASGNDNCSAVIINFATSGSTVKNGVGNVTGLVFKTGASNVIYTAVDASGNSKSCSFTIQVTKVGLQPLTINVGANNANCGDTINVPITVDNFSNVLSAQFGVRWDPSKLKYVGTPQNINANLPIVLTDINFNQSLVVNGKINFSWIDLQNIGKSLPNNSILFTLRFVASGNDVVLIDTSASASPKLEIAGGTPIVKYAVVVNNGAQTIVDKVPPVIVCPLNVTVTASLQTQTGTASAIDPTFSDNCGNATLSYLATGATAGSGSNKPSNVFNIGTTTVLYTAADANNNSASCSFSVLVNKPDETPLFTIVDVSGKCGDTICVPVKANNFLGLVSTQFTIDWDTDDLEYVSVGSLNNVLPVLSSDFAVDPQAGIFTFSWYDPEALGKTLGQNESLFCIRFVVKGGVQKTAIKFDLSKNAPTPIEVTRGVPAKLIPSNVVNGSVLFDDKILPTIVCPNNVTVSLPKGMSPSIVNQIDPVFADNCTGAIVDYILTGAASSTGSGSVSGKFFNLGTTNVNYIVTDAGGNTASCNFIVVVNENFTPTIFTLGLKSNSGNCDDPLIAVDILTYRFDSIVSLQNTIVWDGTILEFVKTDNFNNSIGITQNDVFVNNGALTTSWSDNTPKSLADGSLLFTMYFKPIGSFGQCGEVKLDTTPNALTPYEVARMTIFNVIPATYITGKVLITDKTPPSIVCPANKIVKANFQQNGVVVNQIDPIASDNCTEVQTAYELTGATNGSGQPTASGELFNVGVTTVTYVASDDAGNTATCSFTVTVKQLPSTNFSILTSSGIVDCDNNNFKVSVKAINFDSIVSTQFTMMYDTSILKLVNLGGFNTAMKLSDTNFVKFPNLGKVSFAWAAIDQLNVLTLNQPDSVTIFELNFSINKTKTGSNTSVTVDTAQAAITFLEVAQGNKLNVIPVDLFNGNINVIDTVKPTIVCPPNVKSFPALVTGIAPQTSDNCQVKNVNYVITGSTSLTGSNDASGTTFNFGTSLVTYTVFDNANNSATCSFNVRVGPDTLYLKINGDTTVCGQDVDLYLTVRNFVEITSISTDIQWDSTILKFNAYTRNSKFDAIDFSNTANRVRLNRISNAPLTLPNEDTIVSIKLSVLKGGLSAIDLLNINAIATGNPPINYIIVAQGNNVLVVDTSKPVLTNCPVDRNIQLASCDTLLAWTLPTVSDNCGIKSLTSSLPSNERYGVGDYEVLFVAEDINGLKDSCKFNISVFDTLAPVITGCVVGGVVAFTPQDTCGAVVGWTLPTVTDECDIDLTLVSNVQPNTLFNIGSTVISYLATDGQGNTSTCTFTVVVIDNKAPKFTTACPKDTVVIADPGMCSKAVSWVTPAAVDNCSGTSATVTSDQTSGDVFKVGFYTVTITAKDTVKPVANEATCSFNISVLDKEAPVFTNGCPQDITIAADLGKCSKNVNWVNPAATDNCSGNVIIFTSDSIRGQVFLLGTHVVTITARDTAANGGNAVSCSFKITVVDEEAPVIINCVKDTTITAPLGECEALFSWADPLAVDNCDNSITFVSDSLKGGTYFSGSHLITVFAIDDAGMTSSCQFTLTVIGNVPPEFVLCPKDTVVFAKPGECKLSVLFDLPGVIGSCGDNQTQIFFSHLPSDTFNVGITTVTLYAESSNGLRDTCEFDIQVKDVNDPVITNCPSNQFIVLPANLCDTAYILPAINAVDNCDQNLVITTSTNPSILNGRFPVGNTVVNVVVLDNSGNKATCDYTVNVMELVNPKIVCPSDVTVQALAQTCKGIATWPAITATDNCDTQVDISTSLAQGDTLTKVKTEVIAIANDDSGNRDTCRFNIVVSGIIPPTFTACPTDITVSSDTLTCGAIVGWSTPTAVSNCGGTVTITTSKNPNTLFPLGTTTVIYIAKDVSGDSAICTFNVTVVDQTKPKLIGCPTDTIKLYVTGTCNAIATWTVPQATDNCTSVKLTSNYAPPVVLNLGDTEIVYVATDSLNNSDSCKFIVSVLDTLPPFINGCPQDVTVFYDLGAGGGVPTWIPPVIIDNCTMSSVVSNFSPGDTLPCYTTQVIYIATDQSGNVSTCSFDVVVLDSIAPVFAKCPSDITLSAIAGTCKGILLWEVPSAFDNCTANVKVVSNFAPNDTVNIGKYQIFYTAIDDSGNSSTCSFSVTVKEDVAPTITCPKPIIVTQDGRIIADTSQVIVTTIQNSNCKQVQINYLEPIGVDNCGVDTTIAVGLLKSGSNFSIGDTFVLYRVFDKSGNFATCRFDIKVLPIEAPKISATGALICEGDMFQLFADSIKGTTATFNWFGPGFLSNVQNPKILDMNVSKTGYYYAQTNINGCLSIFSDSVLIDILTPPIASPDQDTVTNKGKILIPITLNDLIRAGQNYTIKITAPPLKGTATIINDSTIQYMPIDSFFIGIDVFKYELCYEDCPNLCSEAIVTINVKTNVPGCPVPTVITPNDDGSNDLLVIPCLTGKEESEIIIFNEWGSKVFQAKPYNSTNWWNGTYQNQPVPDGTYYYIFFEDRKDATKAGQKGYITVFR